jgi:hypothetical protein
MYHRNGSKESSQLLLSGRTNHCQITLGPLFTHLHLSFTRPFRCKIDSRYLTFYIRLFFISLLLLQESPNLEPKSKSLLSIN